MLVLETGKVQHSVLGTRGGGRRGRGELNEPGMLSVEMRQGSKWSGHRGQDSQDIEVLFSICPSVQKVE